jgi:hypothetical protein
MKSCDEVTSVEDHLNFAGLSRELHGNVEKLPLFLFPLRQQSAEINFAAINEKTRKITF